MNLLLDTHTFNWWHEQPKLLSPTALAAISNPSNDVYLSLASVWELQIKIQIGKFKFVETLKEVIATERANNNIQLLAVELDHILYLEKLPYRHKDPFDRILIAQTAVEKMVLVSADQGLAAYGANLLWQR